MQDAGGHPPPNDKAVQPERGELRARDNTVLSAGKPGNRLPARRWQEIVADFATYPCHLARVALRALQVGDWCDGCVMTGARRTVRRAARPGWALGGWMLAAWPAVGPALPRGGRAVRRSGVL